MLIDVLCNKVEKQKTACYFYVRISFNLKQEFKMGTFGYAMMVVIASLAVEDQI
ncbi:hypothetical protein [Glaesserella parasuis]|uniref:hypothetical protein n=1 Tax=Glaesserella parasuis TaxID=738 RepID=UPI000A445E91|nr:hypothetical protein [Glaesserella parasuis]MCT8526659.1 hypothetical protein [Glaesserella parasuis]MCT8528055.1 hypothetical protein [Glaesserella parasuis]MCT8530876.1 hypothetical protein [Glaesserella parasuis]MCT8533172.1 hypothetical protein [Glaesserella parasuis]MCT8539461.1 hypothetical protein [Glaesserella parasuis]